MFPKQLPVMFSVFLCFISSTYAQEQSQTTTQTQTIAAPKSLSARIIRKIAWSEQVSHKEKTWESPDTSKNFGVIVKMKLERGTGYATDEFVLAYKNLESEHKSTCAGLYDQKKWVIIGDDHIERADFFTFDPDGGGYDLLFVIPKDVKEVRLLYKGQPTGNPLPIKQE